MKRLFAPVVMLCMLPYICEAQQHRTLSAEWRDGDYIVRRYVVEDNAPHKAEYELHYAINSSTTAPNFDQNDIELARLDRFFSELKNDTLRHVSAITITGYASPDGTVPFNTELARERAQQLSAMLAKRYGLKGYNVTITSHVEPWSATTEAIEESELKNRGDIVKIVNAKEAPMTVDYRLKRDGEAWNYLKDDVLPDMRRAVVSIAYTEDHFEDSREYSPVPREVIVVEEVVEKDKCDKHGKCDKRNKCDKHNKHHKRKHRIVDEWDGIIIDFGAANADNSGE